MSIDRSVSRLVADGWGGDFVDLKLVLAMSSILHCKNPMVVMDLSYSKFGAHRGHFCQNLHYQKYIIQLRILNTLVLSW